MNCREFYEFILAYMEGDLPEEQRSHFEEHISLCPPCVQYLEQYRQTVKIETLCSEGDGAVPDDVPEGLVKAILAAVKKDPEG